MSLMNKKLCNSNCKGLETETLDLKPDNHHFVQLARTIGIEDFYKFFIKLGMEKTDLDNLNFRYFSNPMDFMLMGLFEWRDKTESDQMTATFRKLQTALEAIEGQHYLCQVHREDQTLAKIANISLQDIPSDDVISSLTEKELIGDCIVHLGIELCLSINSIKETIVNHPKNLYGQIHNLLIKWKSGKVKPTIYRLMVALKEIKASEGLAFVIKTYGVEPNYKENLMLQSSENVLKSIPHPESCNQIRTTGTSTKVCVRIKAGKKVFVREESPGTASLAGFTIEQINFTKMGIIVLNILTDASYDLLKQDIPNPRPRSDCDITHLYSELRKLNKHIPTNGWGGVWSTLKVTDIAVGDDIERIRLTRNELQHSTAAELGDTRFNELCNILSDLLKRFDQLNKPTRLYTDRLNEILAKTISAQEFQSIGNEILGMDITVEIDTQ